MKAAQINKYNKNFKVTINEVPIPNINENEILIKVKAAAVNPLDILNLTGKVKLIQNYKMPLTIGNECAGIVEKIGENVKKFNISDCVYTRLPINKIGAFAEYVAVNEDDVAMMPNGYDFKIASTIPLTALTSYQAIVQELNAKKNDTILINGGSGSFGRMFVPIAKYFGINCIVVGNGESKNDILNLGAIKYFDYKKDNYANSLKKVDFVINAIGQKEFKKELSILKENGILLSLKGIPNKNFAVKNNYKWFKKTLFSLAGKKFDLMAKKQNKQYKFMFVNSNGDQLKEITKIIETIKLSPKVDSKTFTLDEVQDALKNVETRKTNGKVVIVM